MLPSMPSSLDNREKCDPAILAGHLQFKARVAVGREDVELNAHGCILNPNPEPLWGPFP